MIEYSSNKYNYQIYSKPSVKISAAIFFAFILIYPVYGDDNSFTISLDGQFYFTGDSMTVLGDRGTLIEILDPDYNLIIISQTGPPETFAIVGPLWEKSGEYTVIVRDGSDTAQKTFFVNIEKTELVDSQRISVSNQKIANSFGDLISEVNAGQQVQITADIKNNQNFDQEFAFVVIIKENGIKSEPRWITGVLASNQALSPSLSWIPKYGGDHSVEIQIWNNPLDKSPISQDSFLEVSVAGQMPPGFTNTNQPKSQSEMFENSPVTVDDVVFVDDSGTTIEKISVDETIDITGNISNNSEFVQEVVFIVQIIDSNGVIVSIKHIQETLSTGESIEPSLPWKTQYPGIYTYEVYVWNNLDDPNALGDVSSSTFVVQ